ncbi:hypothetical protein IPA_04460 [Ignicoccus pacificus DSM 13166]|uniref:SAM-dependent chlorinase/fluorinase n=1 Tax=Ignicoccus pacificus DSM 13166 TaxID=940294 RepID=A0A977KC46_9CREN|nr:hypothetical protein IPA_04460 [Ignicoccus pacificus DSM 13166]
MPQASHSGRYSVLGLITDYGYKDVYAGILRVVAKDICQKADVVDITHGIEKFNVLEGAVATLVTLPHLPDNSTLVVVVDPGVGSRREAVAAKIGRWYVVAPNNGVLWLAAKEYGLKEIVKIEKEVSKYKSFTFHGRDIFVPAGALLECGYDINELGPSTKLIELPIALKRKIEKKRIETTVVYVDHFGNVMTWARELPFEYGDEVLINRKWKAKVVKTFSEVEEGKLAVYLNSFGYVEIAKYLGSASQTLGLREGMEVTIESA